MPVIVSRVLIIAALLAVLSVGRVHAQPAAEGATLDIATLAERSSVVGPSDLFTGTAEHAMTHTALQGAIDGEVVTWMAPVTDAEYFGTNE